MMSDPSGHFWYYGDLQVPNSVSFKVAQLVDYCDFNIIYILSKGPSQPLSEFKGLSDEVIRNRARDKSLSVNDRRKYQREEKYRKLRNIKKRTEQFSIVPEEPAAQEQFTPSYSFWEGARDVGIIIGTAILAAGIVGDNAVGFGGDDAYLPQVESWLSSAWQRLFCPA